ncbi:MAG: penicillin-binding transpeptidase domain-containing protein [Campylobacter hyointestinalis]
MKHFIFSLFLKENKVNPLEIINTYGGKYKLGQRIITDSHKNAFLSAEDIIVESSNIGMIQIVERLSEVDLYNGLLDFGFSKKTGIDLSYEQVGLLPSINELRNKTYRATLSYGYGLQATFMQLLNAYNTINNNGVMITPRIASHLEKYGKAYKIEEQEIKTVLPIEVAKTMKRILIKVVESDKGTARKARIDGLSIGGKTGTAHIATVGGYSDKRYNASFFGFVNDSKGNSYTIGVLVREPMKPYPYYFASWSALPIFKNTVELMIENGYLFPMPTIKKSQKVDEPEVGIILD